MERGRFLVSRQHWWNPPFTVSRLLFWFFLVAATLVHSLRTFPHLSRFPALPFCISTTPSLLPSACRLCRNSHGGVPSELQLQSRKACYPLCIFTYTLCARVCVWLAPVIFCLFEGFPRCRTKTFPRGVTMCVKVCVHAFQCSLCHCLLRWLRPSPSQTGV